SAPLAVKKNTDYVLRLSVRGERDTLAAKVTNVDRRLALASAIVSVAARESKKAERRQARRAGEEVADDGSHDTSTSVVELPFATGPVEQVRVVLSNNGGQAMADVGTAELYEAGPTAGVWTRWLRGPVRGVQKNLYTTARMLPLELLGLLLLGLARRWRVLAVLLAVPIYYLAVQSALHT